MFEKTSLLIELYQKYDIAKLKSGVKEDKLGDLMEEYCAKVFEKSSLLSKYFEDDLNNECIDEYLFKLFLSLDCIGNSADISEIKATTDIDPRESGGKSKTDVIVTLKYNDNREQQFPISVKQTSKNSVSIAEFDVDTIVREVGIEDQDVISLMKKHQDDGSAKNFSAVEKQRLKEGLKPYLYSLSRWAITGSPTIATDDLRIPKIMIRFKMNKNDDVNAVAIYETEKYLEAMKKTKNGRPRTAGFGTGLYWTRASGSGCTKIQFKGYFNT